MKRKRPAFLKKGNRSQLPWRSFVSNSVAVRLSLMVLTALTGILYIVQINITATKGYDIRDLEQQIVKLGQDKSDLELQKLELESMDRVVSQLPNYQLVEARPDGYINTSTATFAAR